MYWFLQIKFEFRIQHTGLYLIIGPELSFHEFLLFTSGPPDEDQGCILNYITFFDYFFLFIVHKLSFYLVLFILGCLVSFNKLAIIK
jgi:hypothetical protein